MARTMMSLLENHRGVDLAPYLHSVWSLGGVHGCPLYYSGQDSGVAVEERRWAVPGLPTETLDVRAPNVTDGRGAALLMKVMPPGAARWSGGHPNEQAGQASPRA